MKKKPNFTTDAQGNTTEFSYSTEVAQDEDQQGVTLETSQNFHGIYPDHLRTNVSLMKQYKKLDPQISGIIRKRRNLVLAIWSMQKCPWKSFP